MEEILARLHQREEAAVKRERALAYAFTHQVRKTETTTITSEHLHVTYFSINSPTPKFHVFFSGEQTQLKTKALMLQKSENPTGDGVGKSDGSLLVHGRTEWHLSLSPQRRLKRESQARARKVVNL